MKTLIVEDNPRLANRLTERLRKHFAVDCVNTGSAAIAYAGLTDYAAIILDLGLPDMSGLQVCRELRQSGNHAPILILTGAGQELSKIELLDAGADDYVVKPASFEELRARIAALSRRKSIRNHVDQLIHNDLIIDSSARSVSRADKVIPLRRKEFDILHYMLLNKGRILTRQMIMDNVWNGESTSWITTIDVHIKHLRDKVDRPFSTKIIKTVYGIGYKID